MDQKTYTLTSSEYKQLLELGIIANQVAIFYSHNHILPRPVSQNGWTCICPSFEDFFSEIAKQYQHIVINQDTINATPESWTLNNFAPYKGFFPDNALKEIDRSSFILKRNSWCSVNLSKLTIQDLEMDSFYIQRCLFFQTNMHNLTIGTLSLWDNVATQSSFTQIKSTVLRFDTDIIKKDQPTAFLYSRDNIVSKNTPINALLTPQINLPKGYQHRIESILDTYQHHHFTISAAEKSWCQRLKHVHHIPKIWPFNHPNSTTRAIEQLTPYVKSGFLATNATCNDQSIARSMRYMIATIALCEDIEPHLRLCWLVDYVQSILSKKEMNKDKTDINTIGYQAYHDFHAQQNHKGKSISHHSASL